MRTDKIKGTLVDFNELEHLLDDCLQVDAWQIELRKCNDDPLDLDELIVHVTKHNGVSNAQLTRELNERFAARAEIQPNQITFHTIDEMRALHGVGSELKERKLVDHRPTQTSAVEPHTAPPLSPPSLSLSGEGWGDGALEPTGMENAA